MGKYFVVLLLFLGVTLTVAKAEREPLIRISDVIVSQPLRVYGLPQNWFNYSNATYNPTRNELYFLANNQMFKLNLEDLAWEEYIRIDIPEDVRQFEYSQYHSGFLFWDRGVGRVYLLDSLLQMRRVDNSFNHMNQFGHGPWVDHRTGEIFAFGGYGLFTTKSFITKFNIASGEWQEQPVANPHTIPGPQLNVLMIPDFDNERIFMIGKRLYRKDVFPFDEQPGEDRAVWEFNLRTLSWTRHIYLDDVFRGDPGFSGWLSNVYFSVHPSHKFFLFRKYEETKRDNIHAYHIPAKKVKDLTSLDPNMRIEQPVFYMAWSDMDQVYYILVANILSNQNIIEISVKKIEIPDPDLFAAWLAHTDHNYWLIAAVTLGFVMISGFVFVFFGTRKKEAFPAVQTKPQICIECDEAGKFCAAIYGDKCVTVIPIMEQKLLKLLLRDFDTPNSVVASDEVDTHLLPDHPSLDYIRRTRNLTIERLETFLQSLHNLGSEKYILRSVNQFDKRKSEYRLNDKYVTLTLREIDA